MSEGLIAIIDYGFTVLKLLIVEAHTYSNNGRAKHLLEKLGFQLDNVSKDSDHYSLYKGKKVVLPARHPEMDGLRERGLSCILITNN